MTRSRHGALAHRAPLPAGVAPTRGQAAAPGARSGRAQQAVRARAPGARDRRCRRAERVVRARRRPASAGWGAILQQLQPAAPQPPPSSNPGIDFAGPAAQPAAATAPFAVTRIEVSGAREFRATDLHALVADGGGRDLTLADLDELAARITRHYRQRGFPLARAIIPALTIRDGLVTIEVIEARYGAVRIENRARVGDALLDATLAPLHPGVAIAQPRLEERLLLMTDIPGIVPGATLVPGRTPATSDLVLDVAPGPLVTGDVAIDD